MCNTKQTYALTCQRLIMKAINNHLLQNLLLPYEAVFNKGAKLQELFNRTKTTKDKGMENAMDLSSDLQSKYHNVQFQEIPVKSYRRG